MPYPPPAGPPELGIFQGIGLVPELPTLVGNYFLTNIGGLTVWSPVAGGVLPDETGHAGEFLTTDGVVANWAPIPPASGNDIRLFGAVSIADPLDAATVLVDSTQAIRDTLAATTDSVLGGVRVGAYVPTGNWAVSAPILIPSQSQLYGDGQFLSTIFRGPGTPADPLQVQGFSGPMIYVTGPSPTSPPVGPFFPLYQSPLVGATGQALQYGPVTALSGNTFPCRNLWLHDSYAWQTWFQTAAVTNVTWQFWLRVNTTTTDTKSGILSSSGPFDGDTLTPSQAWGFYLTTLPGYAALEVILTTVNGVFTYTTTGGVISTGVNHNIEMGYDGSFLDLYVDGVNQAHVAATGAIYQAGWEGTSIGDSGPEYQAFHTVQFQGALDSIRLSNTKRHTGTGSFTPPVAKYTWDANTFALINFDKPFVTDMPVILGEAVLAGSQAASNPHYIRVGAGWTFTFNNSIKDLLFDCRGSTAGIVHKAGARSLVQNCFINTPAHAGANCTDGNSFFVVYDNTYVYGAAGTSFVGHGVLNNCTSQFGSVGVQWLTGAVLNHNENPSSSSYIPFVFGPSDPNFGYIYARGNSSDNEGSFPNQRTVAMIFGTSIPSATFIQNTWLSLGAVGKPTIIYTGTHPTGFAEHVGDSFIPDEAGSFFVSNISITGTTGTVSFEDCEFGTQLPQSQLCDTPGFVVQRRPGKLTNVTGMSISDTPANNYAGTFSILNGYTSGGPTFLVPEPDADYEVVITYKGHNGSAPAAGSTIPGPYVTSTTGFVMTQGTDPASDSQTLWSYVISRTYGAPEINLYLPALPTTVANPFAGETMHEVMLGATVIPTVGSAFRYQTDIDYQQVIESGNGGSGAQFWGIAIRNGASLSPEHGAAANAYDSFVSSNGGNLCGLLNPGPHNIVFRQQFSGASRTTRVYVDGGLDNDILEFIPAGAQPASVYIGEKYDTTDALTVATLRSAVMGTQLSQVLAIEQDAGPQPGDDIAAFFGDNFTVGLGATSGGTGGFATQVAENRYGTTYYYIAAYAATTPAMMSGANGILHKYWVPWGNLQADFTGICLLGGFNDILGGALAVDVFADISLMLDGIPAAGTFVLPIHFNSAPPNVPSWPIFDSQAWAIAGGFTVANPTFTIAGQTFTATFSVDAETTATNLASAINANGTTNVLVTASAQYEADDNTWHTLITAKALGSAGNGITTTTNGAGGAIWYPGGTTQFGIDVICTIQGVDFVANFDTNAATTCNNLIALVNASGPTLALGTPSNVSNRMVFTAVTPGTAGNAITTGGTGGGGSGWSNGAHLVGGADGAVQTGIPAIVVCTVPPFGQAVGYSAGKETQRNALNTSIRAIVAAGVVVADVDVAVRDAGDHTKIDPAFLAGDNTNLNDAGHAAVYAVVSPLLP